MIRSMSLSDIPDEILNLISIRLNGFDNCSLWMASDSILKQRLVNNIITEFDINYTIPGRYLWPGNFLKRLQKLYDLAVTVDQHVFHIPIENIKIFPIPTLKGLELKFGNIEHLFCKKYQSISNHSTGPTPSNKYINLNDYYPNLEYLETPLPRGTLFTDFVGCLPLNLHTLLIRSSFELDHQSISDFNTIIQLLPQTLTSLDIQFNDKNDNLPPLDFSKLPPNLTQLGTDVRLDENSYHMIPKSLKSLDALAIDLNFAKLSLYLPTGLEHLLLIFSENRPTGQMFARLENLTDLVLDSHESMELLDLMIQCPPKLQSFYAYGLVIPDSPIPSKLFSDCLHSLSFNYVFGMKPQIISSLPPSLTDLEIRIDDPDEDHPEIEPFAFLSLLPKNLKSLVTNLRIVEKISLLPQSITFLDLDNPTDVSYFDRLPPKLQSLTLKQKLPRSLMEELPETLESLSLNSQIHFDDEIVAMLPRGLTELTLSAENITDSGVAYLPPHLRSLRLYKNTTLTDDAIPLLPRSLMTLDLYKNPNFTDACIKHLPPKLTELSLLKATKITSKSCKDLPKYLRQLLLYKCMDWDPKELLLSMHALPQFIQRADLGKPKAQQVWSTIMKECNPITPRE